MVDEDGYVRVTDFGISKILEGKEKASTYCGTPEYMAPEILKRTGHSFPVDWWSLGIFVYEMITGSTPFYTSDRNKMSRMIKKFPVVLPSSIAMSEECKDFIIRLLDKNPDTRLGSKGDLKEILDHPWMKQIDVDKVMNKEIEAPLKPHLSSDPLDINCFKKFTEK